ncbi:MAG TPA: cytochrome c3 family protein [candidate division Zixibacteria bacterium]|nr:cytochrome c3 family protein [candidate division Zixibacteria bacterium]
MSAIGRPVVRVCLLLFFLLLAPAGLRAQPQAESCVTCHQALGDTPLGRPAQTYSQDIHSRKGFGCVSCHGGDGTAAGMEAMDRAKGYIGKPSPAQVIEVCGRCHSDPQFMRRYNPAMRVDQVAEYFTSVHGRRLREQKDANVATCASCHTPHSIRPPTDPRSSVYPLNVADTCGACHADAKRMAPYKIATDQVEKYKRSIHWNLLSVKGDLSAPTCNDCHGNHGAAPPGISWVGNVCGQCHPINAELFNKSRHGKIFVQMGIPGCASCHSNHEIAATGDAMLGVGEGAVCAGCHSADDTGGRAAAAMRDAIEQLARLYDQARATLSKAEHAGMEVSQAFFELNGAKTALVKARASVHGFDLESVKKEIQPGLEIARKAQARGTSALEEIRFRRRGLAVSVAIILALIGGLVVKIRRMERGR